MANTPWLTSNDIISVIERRCAVPLAQDTFSTDDLLDFVNSEMKDSQVPTVMIVHNEYFVYRLSVPLVFGQNRYPIPDRAIGMKLRDLFFQDTEGNLKKMSRINPDNQDIYLTNQLVSTTPYMFFIEGNDICLTLPPQSGVSGNILMTFFLRPNNLVTNDNAFIVSSFTKQLTVSNASLLPGDSITINNQIFTAVSATPSINQFLIDVSDIATATNLVTSINANGIILAANGTPATSTVGLTSTIRNISASSLSLGLLVSPNLILNSASPTPTSITDNIYIDFLQTKPGHQIYSFDKFLSTGSVGGNYISILDTVVPLNFIVGDYICCAYTCIIPQLPPELHSLLAERACARLLSAQGDIELLGDVNANIKTMESNQAVLIDNRVEGSPQKVVNRNSLLNVNKYRLRTMM